MRTFVGSLYPQILITSLLEKILEITSNPHILQMGKYRPREVDEDLLCNLGQVLYLHGPLFPHL